MEEVSDDGDNACPLCMEEMDLTDKQLKPCKCGYEICVWCWHHIMEMSEKDNAEGRCPACRMPYDKEKIVGTSVNCERLSDFNSEKRQRSNKLKARVSDGRKHLSNVRVIQRNLVYVVGIPASLADEKNLERREFFGQYGKILKVSVSRSGSHNAHHSTTGPTASVYITFVKEEDACRCIQAVNGYILEGRPLRACFGTTKYCYAWLKNMPCNNPDCLYLHDPCNNPDCLYLHDVGTQEDSFTKEEMVSKCGSIKTQQFHDLTNPSQQRWGHCLPPPETDVSCLMSASSSKPLAKSLASNAGGMVRTPLANGTTGKTILPATVSWGPHVGHEKSLPVRIPAVQGSTNSKSSLSRSPSVSPPLSLPTSAVVVAAAPAPGLSSDQTKPSLVVMDSHALPSSGQSASFMSANQSATTGTDMVLNESIKASVAVATSELFTSRKAVPGKEDGEIRLTTKSGAHEGLERSTNTLSCCSQRYSSRLRSRHVDRAAESKITDSVSTSSRTVCGVLCKDGLLNTPSCNKTEANHLDIDRSTCMLYSRCNEKHSLDTSHSCANLSQNYVDCSPENSLNKSMKKHGIRSSEKSLYSSDCKEQYAELFVKSRSESVRQTRESLEITENKADLDSQMPNCVNEVQGPADAETLLDGSLGTSLNVGDLSISLPPETLDNDILHGDDEKIGSTDHKVEEKSCLSQANVPVDSIQGVIQESGSDITDKSARIGVQNNEQVDVASTGVGSEKLECMERMGNVVANEDNIVDTDVRESSIISNILSLNFDVSEDTSLESSLNLAKLLLAETDKNANFSNDISSSWKFQNSRQSRFLFARQEGSREGSRHPNPPSLASSSQLQREWSNVKDFLDNRNEHVQLSTLFDDVSSSNVDGFQPINNGSTSHSPSEATVTQPSISRSLHSAPPGFSLPNRPPTAPPPGFFSHTRVDWPHEYAAFANGNQVLDNSVSLSNMYSSAYNQPQTLPNGRSNDVEFIDPAIMAVGKGKLPLRPSQPGSAIYGSNFNGLLPQGLSSVNGGNALLGFGTPFSQQLNPIDYDGRLDIYKQRAFYTSSNLAPSRQQLKFPDQVGGTLSSYLSSQNETLLSARATEKTQPNLNAQFSQVPFQQTLNSVFRNSSAGANDWNNWNRMHSGVEPGLDARRLEPNLAEIRSNERFGPMESKVGLMRMFPTYDRSNFQKPSSDDFYSRIFDM